MNSLLHTLLHFSTIRTTRCDRILIIKIERRSVNPKVAQIIGSFRKQLENGRIRKWLGNGKGKVILITSTLIWRRILRN